MTSVQKHILSITSTGIFSITLEYLDGSAKLSGEYQWLNTTVCRLYFHLDVYLYVP